MKTLVLGGEGMLGHIIARHAAKIGKVYKSSRSIKEDESWVELEVSPDKPVEKQLLQVIKSINPDIVINCIGHIKQRDKALESKEIFINSWFPHLLKDLTSTCGFKLIHFSTDCVFDGLRGNYHISDSPNPKDLYGISKFAGEISGEGVLTIRTSIIGHELKNKKSLLEWFLSQEGSCDGYEEVVYSGVTTTYLANLLEKKVIPSLIRGEISGVYQLASQKITKYELLKIISSVYSKEIKINKVKEPKIDRSLLSLEIFEALQFEVPSWEAMISEMYEEYLRFKEVYEGRE